MRIVGILPPGRHDDGGNEAGVFLLGTVRGEQVEVHRRAQADVVNLRLGNSREHQLVAIGTGDIEA